MGAMIRRAVRGIAANPTPLVLAVMTALAIAFAAWQTVELVDQTAAEAERKDCIMVGGRVRELGAGMWRCVR